MSGKTDLHLAPRVSCSDSHARQCYRQRSRNLATAADRRNPVRAPCILIAGPTASGKSALALALAEKLGGVIVNADSMQVYRDLRVITARPTPEEEARAAASALRPCRCGGELFGRALVPRCRSGARGSRARRPHRDPGRRHRALFQGADRGPGRGAADPGRHSRRRAGAPGKRGRAGAPCRAGAARSGDGAAADAGTTARASRARWKWCWRPAARCPTGTAKACRRLLDAARAIKVFLDPRARASCSGGIETRFAAMLAPARSTRCGARRRAGSIRRCRP